MAATDRQIADAARDSLKRILDTDTSSWSEGERRQQQLEIDRLTAVITEFEKKDSRTNRQFLFPVTRVDA